MVRDTCLHRTLDSGQAQVLGPRRHGVGGRATSGGSASWVLGASVSGVVLAPRVTGPRGPSERSRDRAGLARARRCPRLQRD